MRYGNRAAVCAAALFVGVLLSAAGCNKGDTADAGPTTAAPSGGTAATTTTVPPEAQKAIETARSEAASRNAANAEARKKAMEAHGMR